MRLPTQLRARGLRRLFTSVLHHTTDVRLALDTGPITPLLRKCGALDASDDIAQVRQFSHGQSNPTYILESSAGARLVLRKQPPGKLLRGAHAVDREFTVIQALHNSTTIPVPRPHVFVDDASVVGTPFYVVDFVDGRFFKEAAMLAAGGAEERAALYHTFLSTCAALHTVDYAAAGLGTFGREGGYIARQTKVWTAQYRAAETQNIPAVEYLAEWLPQALPTDDDRTALVHGDLRVDNMLFSARDANNPAPPAVEAVLDWELSTLGHPSADLALATLPYLSPSHLPGAVRGFVGEEAAALAGIPSEAAFVGRYVELTGGSPAARVHLDYYRAFTCFRMASILQGVYARSLAGQASAPDGGSVGALAATLAELGEESARRYEAQPDRLGRQAGAGAAFVRPTRPAAASASAADPALAQDPEERAAEVEGLRKRVRQFVDERVLPIEGRLLRESYEGSVEERWAIPPEIEALKAEAKADGLWNLFLPAVSGLTNREYATLAEEMGRSLLAPELFNCSAPDTGNMEVLHMFGTALQREQWLAPLLEGEMRSCFAMTEPAVASSDATNMAATVAHDGDELVLTGKKWWISGAADPRCGVCIFMGRDLSCDGAARHAQHSMVIVPMDAPGLKVVRPLRVLGFDDAPHGHCEVDFDGVRVPKESMILGAGRGFEIAQARLGPGRIHHCMRLIGHAERSLALACARASERVAFGKPLAQQGVVQQQIARSRIEIEQARLLTLHTADQIDRHGTKHARNHIAMIKVVAPQMAQDVIDRCMQIHGGMGVSTDTPMAHFFMWARCLRLADGPDEVHLQSVAKGELRPYRRE